MSLPMLFFTAHGAACQTGERCGVCLKTMEKIDKGEDKKHTGKLTSIPEDKIFYYLSDLTHAPVLDKRY